jgi:hypothetical protein
MTLASMTEKTHICIKECRFGGSKMTQQHLGNLKMTLASMTERKNIFAQ